MTTSDEQYVPDEEDVRADYALGGARDTIGDIDYSALPDLQAEFDRFLARVRRDAARKALGDMASDFDLMGSQEDGPEVARWIRAVIDTEYPETEDQT